MKKYKKIVGYENYVGEKNFNNNNGWEGYIVCYDNNWFEGIGTDEEKIYKVDKLIFGINNPDENGIFFYKISSRNVCEPHMITGSECEEGYDGDLYALSFTGPVKIGISRVILKDITKEELPENFALRLEELKEKNDYKTTYDSLKEKVQEQKIKVR